MINFKEMEKAIAELNKEKSMKLAKEAIKEGIDPSKAINEGFAKGLERVGVKFENLEYYLPQLIISADIMNKVLEIFQPHFKGEDESKITKGTIMLGTIEGDQHDIGKNIVKALFKASGFKVHDLGRDVPVKEFVERAKELNPDIIGVSALMSTTMARIPDLISELKEMDLRKQYKVMVGGAPVLPKWAEEIGADGYGENASAAVRVAEQLIDAKKEEG